MKKYTLCLLFTIGCLSTLSAQQEVLVVDTVYSKCLAWNGYYLLIDDQQESLLVKDDTIKSFPAQVSNFKAGYLGVPLVQVDSRCYLLNDALDFDPDSYVNLDLQRLSDLCVAGEKAAYVKDNTVFVADFVSHQTDTVLANATVSSINEQYIYLKQSFKEEGYIYHFETQKIVKLPPAFKYPKTDHPYFILNASLDENIHVLDLALNEVISPEEGYTDYYVRGDLLVVYGRRKPVKVFYKNEPLQLEGEYIDAECNYYSLCFLTNIAAKIAVLNPEGEFLTEAIFDESYQNTFQDKDIISITRGGKLELYTAGWEPLFEGDYERVSYMSDDRFLIEKAGSYKVIDRNKAEIVPSLPIVPGYVNIFKEYGPTLLFAYNGTESVLYDYQGTEIVRWINEQGAQFANSGKYFRGLNLQMIASLNDEQEARVNPSGHWIWREKRGRMHFEFLCDKSGKRLTNNFKRITRLQAPNQYLVRTITRKTGIIRMMTE